MARLASAAEIITIASPEASSCSLGKSHFSAIFSEKFPPQNQFPRGKNSVSETFSKNFPRKFIFPRKTSTTFRPHSRGAIFSEKFPPQIHFPPQNSTVSETFSQAEKIQWENETSVQPRGSKRARLTALAQRINNRTEDSRLPPLSEAAPKTVSDISAQRRV